MKVDPKTKTCPCGAVAVKRTAGVWSCQRCIEWDAKIYGGYRARGFAGVQRYLKKGELPIESAEVFA